MTQTQLIRDFLVHHPEGITPLEALDKFGCFRLASRIDEIRQGKDGQPAMNVVTENQTRGGKTYACYKLATEARVATFPPAVNGEVVDEVRAFNPDMSEGVPKINLLPEQTLF